MTTRRCPDAYIEALVETVFAGLESPSQFLGEVWVNERG